MNYSKHVQEIVNDKNAALRSLENSKAVQPSDEVVQAMMTTLNRIKGSNYVRQVKP